MLATRQCPGDKPWLNRIEAIDPKPPSQRMSSYDNPLTTQPDWHGTYSFLPPGEGSSFSQPFEPPTATGSHDSAVAQQLPKPANFPVADRPAQAEAPAGPASHQPFAPQPLRPNQVGSLVNGPGDSRSTAPDIKGEFARDSPRDVPSLSLSSGSLPLGSRQAQGQGQDIAATRQMNEDMIYEKEEDEDMLDDDEMVEGEGEMSAQTAAERSAARRKMKRFRLTHQQTRFLMSEFAKQPHPDAAHRERLSSEIPGLSPRQVQVWFQNRRAKIKRLTADDRDRMIKMRAVPDDFDNVQALHSPYGAVHGMGPPPGHPVPPPVDFGHAGYPDHMMRPLMVDTIRREGEDHMSPTGLSPGFGNIGFNPASSMNNPDIMSPMSPASNERGYYSAQMSSPVGQGPRPPHPYDRQNTYDPGAQTHSPHARQPIRPLQPLHLRETVSRSRSESLGSPLRTSMSWKGNAIDYGSYPGGGSPGMSGRAQSTYQPEPMSSGTPSGLHYDSGSYSGPRMHSPPKNINYASVPQPQSKTRLRASSATLPLALDLRHQYRSGSAGGHQPLQPLNQPASASIPRALSNTPYDNPGASPYTTSYPSAPLTAPVDFTHPKPPAARAGLVQDYSVGPQMSAPIAPPPDFTQALHGSSGTRTPTGTHPPPQPSSTRTPMRDQFGGGPLDPGQAIAASAAAAITPGERGVAGGDYFGGHQQHQHQEGLGGSTTDPNMKRDHGPYGSHGQHAADPRHTSS